ncbi:MAG TPA: hypothetical protein VEL69_02575 [Ktedonobacteraceae bacterium]|nr:hypothetical protein [Ktedonobacteraceae bacterium]
MEQKQEQPLQIQGNLPRFDWPTSKPGPRVTQPPPGQKPMPGRTDQVVEIAFNQDTGSTPAASSQAALKKRKRK